ncbi:MAG: nucleotidyltransferase domain-containing protein [Bacteroidales bacterium]|nr:nucleotidyltransferase domain-containing protein [Bacteroidales bacterium]
MKDKNYILQLIKKSVKSTEPNAILILYGSYARGDYRDDSDLGLLVLVDKDIHAQTHSGVRQMFGFDRTCE